MRIRNRLIALLAVVALSALSPIAVAEETVTTDSAVPAVMPTAPAVAESWTARILYPVVARKSAGPDGKVYKKLRHYTPWAQGAAVYMVTESTMVGETAWVRLHLPFRPNGAQGWVPAEAVELKKTTTWIRISTNGRSIKVFKNGKVAKKFKVAVGAARTPTPKGLFAIYDPVRASGQLGPHILVLTAHSNVLKTFAGGDGIAAIHGWPSSSVLGKAVSNGCIRMSRDGVRALARYAQAGVPVEIV